MRNRTPLITTTAALVLGCALAFAHAADPLSTSIMHPSPVPANGIVGGVFPEGETRYYLALDVQPGDLVSQLSFSGREGAGKEVELEVLDASARTSARYWIHGSDASLQATRGFPIDAAGRQLVRLRVKGPATAYFCLELGGKAFPATAAGGCPAAPQAAANPAAAPVKSSKSGDIEVVDTRCEQRLRVGADVFFPFDQATIRPEAEPTLAEIGKRVAASPQPIVVEGHTDAKGADDYNQRLSEQRASSVKAYLLAHGTGADRVTVVGWGKRKPVAPNEHADGSDDPAGRAQNRRVEIVLDTCA